VFYVLDDATLVLIKSLQNEVDEWKSKYELMKSAHDMVLEMLASQQSTPAPTSSTPAAKNWSPIKLDSLELDDDELQAYHNGPQVLAGQYLEHDDFDFDESNCHLTGEDHDGGDFEAVQPSDRNGMASSPSRAPVDESVAVVQEAYSQIPREDARLIAAGVRAAFDYMAQCQIRSSMKLQAALASLNSGDASERDKQTLKPAAVDPAVLKVSTPLHNGEDLN
jgi:hypothetical protein